MRSYIFLLQGSITLSLLTDVFMKLQLNNLAHHLKHIWPKYNDYVNALGIEILQDKSIDYWKNHLFIKVILYALPICVVSAVPVIIIELKNGQVLIAVVDFIAVLLAAILLLNKHLSLQLKRWLTAIIVIIFSILKTAISGLFEIGSIYLLALSVFIALSFSRKMAYLSVLLNLIICIGFACIIGFNLINTNLLERYTLDKWIIASVNFMFINLSMVILVMYLISGLENTIKAAKARTVSIKMQNEKLKYIALMHSHEVRAPLAKIIGLVALLEIDAENESNRQIIVYLDKSTKELDTVITNIIDQAGQVDI